MVGWWVGLLGREWSKTGGEDGVDLLADKLGISLQSFD
jgi:hypothetical protein